MATAFWKAVVWLAGCLTLLAGGTCVLAAPAAAETSISAHAEKGLREAEALYRQSPTNATAAWQLGRACFDLAEFATNNTQRAKLAEQGIAACRVATARDPLSAAAYYYLAMNLGQLARTRGLSALKLVDQMEQAFTRAGQLDPRIHYAGPDRNLGLLYRDAPSIGSVGSRPRAREHLRRAVELAPQFPENRLSLIEAYTQWGDRAAARRELETLQADLPAARTNFVGAAWAGNWADWEPRLRKLQKKLEPAPKTLDSPRDSR